MRAFLVVLVVLATGRVGAQEGRSPPDAPVKQEARAVVLVPGEGVRVELRSGQHVTGDLLEAGPGALVLETEAEPRLTLRPSDVTRLSVRRRRMPQGTLMGGAAGTGVGTLIGLVTCLVSRVEDQSVSVPLCTGAMALVGSAIGAGAGTLLGLALPRWSPVSERPADGAPPTPRQESVGVLSRWFAHPGPIGELGFHAGYARELNVTGPQGGPGGRLHLLARLGEALALGSEVAWYPIPSVREMSSSGSPYNANRQFFLLGVLGRAGMKRGPVRPAALLGLSLSSSRDSVYLAYSLGAEVEVRPVSALPPLALEARYHDNLQQQSGGRDPRFLTFGAGTRIRW